MSLSGSLSDFSVLETLQVIGLQRKSGLLEIQSGRHRTELRFSEGRLTGCQPSRPTDPDPLLEALVGWGVCEAAAARATRPSAGGPPNPEALRRLCPSRPELLEEIRDLVLQGTLDQVLLLERGHFRFTPGPGAEEGGWNVEQALLESMRRLDEAADLRAGGWTPDRVARSTGTPGAATPLENAVVRACDGRRNLKDVARRLGLAEYDVLTSARDLAARGTLRVTGRKSRSSSSGPLILEQPRRLRSPGVPAALAIAVLVVAVSGWLAHGLTATAGWPAAETAIERRADFEEERALRQALEVHNLRQGAYPTHLEDLTAAGLWPAGDRASLSRHRYVAAPGGYLLDGIPSDALTIQPAASARSEATASAPAPPPISSPSSDSVSEP